MKISPVLLVALLGVPMACKRRDARPARAAVAEAASGAGDGAARLDSATRRVVAFLRGDLPFDSVRTADTVVLRLAPEGGGHEARIPRAALRTPTAWTVHAGRKRYVLAPPTGFEQLTTRVGRHFNCTEYALATRAPAWASRPHVGVRLAPTGATATCLRTWNATFVFDTSASRASPRLVGVLYDQWEW